MSVTGKLVLLAIMLFCHIADDYYLQGILSQMKQRGWWEKNAPHSLYRNDYKMALAEHAFSWSFVMATPLLVTALCTGNEALMRFLLGSYIVNTAIHATIDNLKANELKINLVIDQTAHFAQIVCTWGIAIALI